jgi:hypothetical protein
MSWKFNDNIIRAGRSWVGTATDEEGNTFEVVHPQNWMIWSDEDKTAAGLVWEEDISNHYDERFYWTADNPKSLEDEEVEGGIRLGLKSVWVLETKGTAGSLLASTDWYVTRHAELGTAIPDGVATYRAAVRTAADTIEAAIEATTTHEEFVALFDAPVDSKGNHTGNPPMYNWPETD